MVEQQRTKIDDAGVNCGLSFMRGGPPFLLHTLCCDWIAVISSDSAAVIAISGPSHGETRDGCEQRAKGGRTDNNWLCYI